MCLNKKNRCEGGACFKFLSSVWPLGSLTEKGILGADKLSWPLGRYTDPILNSDLVCVPWASCLGSSVLLFKTRVQGLTQLSQEQTTSLYQHWSSFIVGGQFPKNTNSGQVWVCLGMSLWLYSCCPCVLDLSQDSPAPDATALVSLL